MSFGIGAGLALMALSLWASVPKAAEPASAPRPSIVFILSDDEDVASHRVMAQTTALIADQGVTFDNYFVSYSFCCPSRTTILRGQYPHNHRIEGNEWPPGGFEKFRRARARRLDDRNLAAVSGLPYGVLRQADERLRAGEHTPLPGWDEWYGVGGRFTNFDYTLNENGKLVAYGHRPEDHLTDVLARKAADVIRPADPAEQPLFLYVAPYDPHSPAQPAAAPCRSLCGRAAARVAVVRRGGRHRQGRPTSRSQPRLAAWQKEALTRHNRERLRALRAVDDMVATIVAALEDTGRLDDTYVVYTSDNGFHMGQHRLFVGKTTAYEEDIRVPMAIRGPGVPAGQRPSSWCSTTISRPTFAAIAGVDAAGVRRRPLVPAPAGQAGRRLAQAAS